MNNLEKAAKLLMPNPRWCELVHKGEGGNPCMYCEADAEAGAVRLDDAGLITPDPPEPQEHGGKLVWPLADPDGFVTAIGGSVFLSDERGPVLTVDKNVARELGHIFLAATGPEGNQE